MASRNDMFRALQVVPCLLTAHTLVSVVIEFYTASAKHTIPEIVRLSQLLAGVGAAVARISNYLRSRAERLDNLLNTLRSLT